MRDTPMVKKHAYERRAYERCPHERHAYEMADGRDTL
jgi:hypothetical protein